MPQLNTFGFMYALMPVGGHLEFVADESGVLPVAQNVFISDDIADLQFNGADNPLILGDAFSDQMHITDAGSFNGTYIFGALGATDHTFDEAHLGFVVQNSVTGQYFYITNNPFTQDDPDLVLVTGNGVVDICFMPGTRLSTPAGEVAVEKLKIGDQVCTADGRTVPVRWIGRQTVAPRFARESRLPIRIRAGALADNVPCRDLIVSADHALLVDGLLVHAGALVNGTSIVREEDVPAIFTYYHVEVDDHSLILAENTPAETFVDNVDRMNFDNWREYEALYPEARPIAELPYLRAKAYRQVPQATRARLAERGRLLSDVRIASAA